MRRGFGAGEQAGKRDENEQRVPQPGVHARYSVRSGGRMVDTIRAWVVARVLVKTHAHDGPAVLRELRRRVKKAFDQAGIEIPLPHMKLVRDREGAT
jgi:hypothetical protein